MSQGPDDCTVVQLVNESPLKQEVWGSRLTRMEWLPSKPVVPAQ